MTGRQLPRRGPGQRAGLSADAVLAEARALVAAEGVERLTMRSLADRLGVAPNALYSHFPDKSTLLDALIDDLLGRVRTDDLDRLDWRAGLRELMGRSRRLLLEQADLLPELLSRPTRGPDAIRLGEATLALLAHAGVTGEKAVEALRILLVYVFGYVALEEPRRADRDPAQRQATSAAAFAAAAGRPLVSGLADLLARPASDEAFETGLRWILDGIAADAGNREPSGSR